ncbi:MAG: elongation factor Ts [Ignavibacteriaceae bacterium]|nr:elongation factor Ts [Ignavibacteriaceae bacterium]
MSITASQVNDLRAKTGAGMMDCKKALTEANGDMEKAVDILRKKGAAVAAKRAEKSANEGVVLTKVAQDNRSVSIVEINCETDFVAKSDDFVKFSQSVIDSAFSSKASSAADIMNANQSALTDLIGKVGEKIEISRARFIDNPGGYVVDYIHPGSKLGVVVNFDNVDATNMEKFNPIAKDIAMQVAAMRPLVTFREEMPKDIVEKEIEIYKEIARKEGKPDKILENIATGKLNKFYSENCLFEQAYIKDNSKSVKDLIAEFNKQNSADVKLNTFLRFHLGDENKQ